METSPSRSDTGTLKEKLIEVGANLLKDYICQWIRRYGESCGQLEGSKLTPEQKNVVKCMEKIEDELDSSGLKEMINETITVPTKEVFMKVACELFSDEKFNWGRVVMLFYFARELVIKAFLSNFSDIVSSIIDWTIHFLRNHVINWIMEQGGWEGIYSYFGTPTWQTVCIFLAGGLIALLVTRKI